MLISKDCKIAGTNLCKDDSERPKTFSLRDFLMTSLFFHGPGF